MGDETKKLERVSESRRSYVLLTKEEGKKRMRVFESGMKGSGCH